MSTVVTLNIRELPAYVRGRPPSVAVADITPIPTEKQTLGKAIRGLVLRLTDPARLRRPIVVGPGAFEIQVRLPSGDVLFDTVALNAGDDASLAFATDIEPPAKASKASAATAVHSSAPRVLQPYAQSDEAQTKEPIRLEGRIDVPLGERFLSSLSDLPELKGYSGLLRLETSTRRKLTERLSYADASPSLIASELFGQAERVQPAQAHGPKLARYGNWKRPLKETAKPRALGREHTRFFVSYSFADDPKTNHVIACMPGTWVLPDGRKAASTRVGFEEYGRGRVRLKVEVEDPLISDVLDFLEQGDADSAARILGPELSQLLEQQKNPFAAAAAGYALLYSRGVAAGNSWVVGIQDLARSFPGLPDGMVLYATLLLQTELEPGGAGDGSAARESRTVRAYRATLEALRRGPPLYRQGLRLLATNLDILASLLEGDEEAAPLLSTASRIVHQWRLRVDPTQPFSVFSLKGLAS